MNNKKLIISIISTLILLLGGTYAAWNLLTEKTEVIMIMDGDQISFNAGNNITIDNILPVYTMEEGITKDIEIYKENGEYKAGIDLYLDLTTWPSAFASSSFRWALYKNNSFLSGGDFLGTKQGDDIKLTSYTQKLNLYDDKDNYKLYLWVDAYQESSIDMMNKTFKVNLYGKVSFYEESDIIAEPSIPNVPELADGMIPIRYNYIIDEWEKADTTNADNNWYDYDSKMWANAVLVTSDTRESYMNAKEGTTINENDILAYYVWIPRYKYLLFNVNSEVSDPREIQIVFEKTTDAISNGDENGQYLSHPAFWWDNNSNNIREAGEELSGIWVGKFETSGSIENPKILPNVASAIYLDIKALYNMNKLIQSSTYLTEEGVNTSDAHMMKNTDWGAVAYLSHSRYGINKEITTNNNSNLISGRQGNYTYNDFLVSNNVITLTKSPGTGTSTSTTGNIYGVYDMSGCASEFPMAVRKTSDTNSEPYYNKSGFNASTMPESKYYNLYEYNTNSVDYSKRILGDATGETAGWYKDGRTFVHSSSGWFYRGGYYAEGAGIGVFNFASAYGGEANITRASRSVLLIP